MSKQTHDHPSPAFSVLTPTLVGLVGAAGSRQALERFFRHLPDDSGMAFVVVVQMAARQLNQLPVLLQKRTNMPIVVAADGLPLQSDRIYVAPAGVQLQLVADELRLQTVAAPSSSATATDAETSGPLDTFLRSLATAQGAAAVAVLLSGTGTDGVAGLERIHQLGGLTLVQEPEEAAYGALPRRAIKAGLATLVATAGELARHLIQQRGTLALAPAGAAAAVAAAPFEQFYATILAQIVTHTGHDLSHYKVSTLHRRIARRMQMAGIHQAGEYVERLQSNPTEALALFQDSLVSVTSFFRDPDAYEMLERDCIPQLFAEKQRHEYVRVWVAGCATGEEAYSMAMQLAEYAAQVQEPPRLQLFATDLDENAIAFARRGIYPVTIAKDISPGRLERFFIPVEDGYQVRPEIREHVLFAVHDLLKDSPFSRLDLICCRNVLIYFNREAQEKVFAIFHYALNRSGYLFLGTSESVDSTPDLFAVLHKQCHLYQRRDVVVTPQRPLPASTLAVFGDRALARPNEDQAQSSRTIEALYTSWSLRRHMPPRILVNERYEITHLFGEAGHYLREREGAVTQNILQRVLPALRLDLQTALYQTFSKGERTISRLLKVEINEQPQLLQLEIGPVAEPGFPNGYAEVLFIVQENSALLDRLGAGETVETDLVLVQRMEEELMRTRERLQSIIEEYEESSQELKTSNEELQSINEELKSTTEELETSKEELQSMNEELITVNGELNEKIEQLHRVNSDLLNFIAATDVGAIFLDLRLRITRFTPRATDLFNLIESDQGRPFHHVTHQIHHTGLAQLAAHVQESAKSIEETVQSANGRWYLLRLFPYRTIDNRIDGVVITFIDISDLKRAESEERQRHQQQALAELSRKALLGTDLETLFQSATAQVAAVLDMELCKVLELSPDGAALLLRTGVGWGEGLVGQATVRNDRGSQAGYTLAAHGPVVVRDLQTETRFHGPSLLTDHHVRSGMSVTIVGTAGPFGVLGVHSRQPRNFATYDVDFLEAVANTLAAAIARRQAAVELLAREAALQRYVDMLQASYDAVIVWSPQHGIEFWNRGAEVLYGYTAAEAQGWLTHELLQTRYPQPLPTLMARLEQVGEWEGEVTHQTKAGQEIYVSTRHQWMVDQNKHSVILEINRNITAQKAAAEALRRQEAFLHQIADNVPALVGYLGKDEQYRFVNAAFEVWFQSPREQIVDGTVQMLIGNEEYARLHTYRQKALAGETVTYEEHFTYPDGVARRIWARYQPDFGADGVVLGFYIFVMDISERKAAEDALRASEERYRYLFETMDEGFCVIEILLDESGHPTDYRFLESNPAFERYTGLQNVKGKTARELVPGLEDHWVEVYGNVALTGEPTRFEQGSEAMGRWFDVYAFRVGNAESRRVAILFDNITERKQVEAALKASETQLRLVTDNISGLVSYVDRDTRYRFVNAAYEKWFAQPRDQIIGRTVHDCVGDAAYARLQPYIARAFAGEHVAFETTLTYVDGVNRTVMVAYVPDVGVDDVGGDGAVEGFYALVTDISSRKQAEERLRFLAEASTILASSLDYTTTLENVAQAAVPGIADWCAIDLVAEDGTLQAGIIAHTDPAKVQWATDLRERYPIDPNAPAGAPHVIRTGESELYPEITDAMLQRVAQNADELTLLQFIGCRSMMIVPLKAHGRILGAITFVAPESARHFDATDLTMAEELAQRAAAAIGNAQLHRAVQQREQQLHASEERLRLATEAGKIGIYDHDLLTKQTNYSDLYQAITGVRADEQLMHEAWLERIHPADRALVVEKWQRAVQQGESYDYAYRIYRPDATLCWLSVSSRVTVDAAGQAIRLTGAVRDITERKTTEEEIQRLNRDLKRRLDELQTLLNLAPIGIFVAHDPACTVITSNAIGAKMLGVQPEENASKSGPTGATLPFRVLRDGHELLPEEMPMQYAVLHNTAVHNWEVDVVQADGRTVNLYEYAIPLHDEEGNVRGCLGVFVDITERKQAEAYLRESEERFRSAFAQAAVGMAHLATDGHYLRVNDRLCQILGYTREELLQKTFMELTHPDDLALDLAQTERQLAGEIAHHTMEKRYIRKDGSIFWANMTASVVRDEAGVVKYGIVVIEDISARKVAEEALRRLNATLEQSVAERTAELERSNHDLDQFAYVASHDLKAPLRGIDSLATWISEDAAALLPDASKAHLTKLRGRVVRMERLLEDLLTYSRVGRRDGQAEMVDTGALVRDIVELLAAPAGFTVTISGTMPTIQSPRAPLELVLRNLIGNAIKHHHDPANGLIQISAQEQDDYVEFTVADNGPGIEPQHHGRIFNMFQTLRPRDEMEGSGMGLAIVQRAIELRRGQIGVESSLGHGATFTFTWPKSS